MKNTSLKSIFIPLSLLFLILIIGTIGFVAIEHYSFIDAFYMTIITMSTVGFGTLHPLSITGKFFTVFLIIFSFGIFAFVASEIAKYIISGKLQDYVKTHNKYKRIEKLSNHIIVCGFDRNGKQVVNELIKYKEKLVIIEKNEQIIKDLHKSSHRLFLEGDASEDEVLIKAGIKTAKALITTLPNDATNLFVVLSARQLNKKLTIISRASSETSFSKLKQAGANNVIMPDLIGGERMAKLIISPDIIRFLEQIQLVKGDNVKIHEISCDKLAHGLVNKSIEELNVRNVSGANIIGLKTETGEYVLNPEPTYKLSSQYKIFTLGTLSEIEKFKSILSNE
ncbi:MAG: potassium channel protein [Bacteroidales bacterium]|nr:potassium channel protein [Bacteroidales bacterium]